MIKEKKYQDWRFLQQWPESLSPGKSFYYDYCVSTGNEAAEQFTATIRLTAIVGQDGIRKGIIYERAPILGGNMNPFLELAYFSGKCFYPVQLFQKNNEWEVVNINTLNENWRQIKEQLLLEFEGAVTASVIRQTEAVLENPVLLGKIYDEDLFLKLYFFLIREQRATDTFFQFSLPLVPDADAVSFKGMPSVTSIEEDLISLSFDAECMDTRTHGALIYGKCRSASATRNELAVKGLARFRYQLDAGTLLIKKITANIELSEPSGAPKFWQIKINTYNYE